MPTKERRSSFTELFGPKKKSKPATVVIVVHSVLDTFTDQLKDIYQTLPGYITENELCKYSV